MSAVPFVSEAHALADNIFARARAKLAEMGMPVTCAAKCSACCSEAVLVDRSEALYILESLSREEIAELRIKVRLWLRDSRKAGLLKQEEPDVIPYRAARLVCPLLKDHLCSVYERRPVACRAHLAVGPRRFCDDHLKRHAQKYIKTDEMMQSPIAIFAENQTELLMDHLVVHFARFLGVDQVIDSAETWKIEIEPEVPTA